MILVRPDDTQKFVPVTGPTLGLQCKAVILTAEDVRDMVQMPAETLKSWLLAGVLTRFAPYRLEVSSLEKRRALQFQEQRQAVEDHNRRLKGFEAIDDFHPAQFTADRADEET